MQIGKICYGRYNLGLSKRYLNPCRRQSVQFQILLSFSQPATAVAVTQPLLWIRGLEKGASMGIFTVEYEPRLMCSTTSASRQLLDNFYYLESRTYLVLLLLLKSCAVAAGRMMSGVTDALCEIWGATKPCFANICWRRLSLRVVITPHTEHS